MVVMTDSSEHTQWLEFYSYLTLEERMAVNRILAGFKKAFDEHALSKTGKPSKVSALTIGEFLVWIIKHATRNPETGKWATGTISHDEVSPWQEVLWQNRELLQQAEEILNNQSQEILGV